jgi:hypothetical protein
MLKVGAIFACEESYYHLPAIFNDSETKLKQAVMHLKRKSTPSFFDP